MDLLLIFHSILVELILFVLISGRGDENYTLVLKKHNQQNTGDNCVNFQCEARWIEAMPLLRSGNGLQIGQETRSKLTQNWPRRHIWIKSNLNHIWWLKGISFNRVQLNSI